jgi:hypothetical protein
VAADDLPFLLAVRARDVEGMPRPWRDRLIQRATEATQLLHFGADEFLYFGAGMLGRYRFVEIAEASAAHHRFDLDTPPKWNHHHRRAPSHPARRRHRGRRLLIRQRAGWHLQRERLHPQGVPRPRCGGLFAVRGGLPAAIPAVM